MGRPRTPTNVLELKGSLKRHPERRDAEHEPKPDKPIRKTVPDWMNRAEAKVWRELKAACAPGVLTGSDNAVLELAACLVAEFRECPQDFPTSRINPMISALARLGMTPADRSKIGVGGPKRNEFDDI